MITARGEDADRIMGLDIGADDYVVKPFSPGEVMARIRAVLRRLELADEEKSRTLNLPGLVIDIANYTVALEGSSVNLTKREIEILWLMASNPNKVFSRENLLNSIWGYDYFGDARTVDTHMKRLRAKLGRPEDASWDIKTVWGVGYRLEVHDV
jgi:DNA-binding response OmpR family regulator